MPLPTTLVNLALRVLVRLPLSFVKTPQTLRKRFERNARWFFRMPRGARTLPQRIPVEGRDLHGLWVSRGRPDRHRIILYLHGGAFVVGSSRTHRHVAASLAGHAGMRALVLDYRLAPEHPFPAAVDDALAAYRFLLETHPANSICLAGDSAGGGLVFSLILAAQNAGLPLPAAAVAFSPFTDQTLTAASVRRNARRDVMLPAQRAREAVNYYLQGHDAANPLASPAFGHFIAPPPSLILASDAELLEDNARMLADRLRRDGGDVRLEIWPGLPHAWPVMTRLFAASERALSLSGRFLRDAMDRTD